ncbi:MAG: hypothetical protein IH936_02095 [Acidobacteria bacterium]|nr:hypothetical protein [Acidobacteriota bacterium]
MRYIAVPVALVLMCGLALAGEAVKSLSPEIYAQLKKGQKIQKVWIGPKFDKTKGFRAGDVSWTAEKRNQEVRTLLTDGVKDIATETGPYTLNLTVVNFSTGARGKVAVEGMLVDTDGEVVAAFSHSAKTSFMAVRGVSPWAAPVDAIISAIAKDL